MKDTRRALVVLILAVLGLYFLLEPKAVVRHESQVMSSQKASAVANPEKLIDRHLKTGRFAEELKKESIQVENELLAPAPDRIDPEVYSAEKAPLPIELKGENPYERLYKEHNSSDLSQRYNSLTPEQRINKKIVRDQFAVEYQKMQEEAFMQEYIENARRAGYEVQLNSNGEIVNFREVGSSEPLRFPQSVKESQPQSSR